MKNKIVALTLTVVFVLLLGGCGGGKDSLVGKWTATGEGMTVTREFKDDGTIIERVNDALRMEGSYTTDGDKLTIAMTLLVNEESGESISFPIESKYSYSVNGNKLTLIDLSLEDGEEVEFTKE